MRAGSSRLSISCALRRGSLVASFAHARLGCFSVLRPLMTAVLTNVSYVANTCRLAHALDLPPFMQDWPEKTSDPRSRDFIKENVIGPAPFDALSLVGSAEFCLFGRLDRIPMYLL